MKRPSILGIDNPKIDQFSSINCLLNSLSCFHFKLRLFKSAIYLKLLITLTCYYVAGIVGSLLSDLQDRQKWRQNQNKVATGSNIKFKFLPFLVIWLGWTKGYIKNMNL